ncbi:MAG: hypothetical protein U9R74_16730 [Pseudomonadota bacterium]|nr:hypothetical protein [Pseudomonadota bacterium]
MKSLNGGKDPWVDPDDAPELNDEFFEHATPKIGGKQVSKEEIQSAFKAHQ